jgi:hypothetical protein
MGWEEMITQNCNTCVHKGESPFGIKDTVTCMNKTAQIRADPLGYCHVDGMFFYPNNYNPKWIRYCSGYSSKLTEKENEG